MALARTLEIEQKFELPPGFAVPDLSDLPGVALVGRARVHELEATYFDTRDLRLNAARRTLRRRTGGPDEGWHLKEPARSGARRETVLPLGRATRTVPAPLRAAVAVHVRGAALAPIARVSTRRTVRPLRSGSGAVLAEVMLDEVETVTMGAAGARIDSWTELEVELVEGGPEVLRAVAARLGQAGATPSSSVSKLVRALGPAAVTPTERPAGPPPGSGRALRVLHDYLATAVEHLLVHDPLVRSDTPDAVHQFRVACRRLRSALATFRPLLDRDRTEPLRGELRWIAGELGRARDAEVVRDHLLAAVAGEPAALRRGPVVSRIRRTLDQRYRAEHAHALAQLDAPRYWALLDALDDLLADLPVASDASGGGRRRLARLSRRSWRRVERAHDRLVALEADGAAAEEVDEALHELRKAAKRARYAAEAMEPVFGEPAADHAAVMADLQSVLGDHQDSVVVREELVALADAAAADGENVFTLGRLHALAGADAERTREEFEAVWRQAGPMAVRGAG